MNSDQPLFIEKGRPVSRSEFRAEVERHRGALSGIPKQPFVLEAENSVSIYSKFVALTEAGFPVLPCPSYQFNDPEYRAFLLAETQTNFIFCGRTQSPGESLASSSPSGRLHSLLKSEIERGASPLILRTSGSSGSKYKYVVHDHRLFHEKYRRVGPHFERTLAFSPFESVAGIETVTEVLCHGSTLIVAGDRLTPTDVADLITDFSIDYFQTTPSFINLLVISDAFVIGLPRSLAKVAYGSEPASLEALTQLQSQLEDVAFIQTYGMTEIGIQKTRLCPEDPSCFALDEQFNPWRIVDGILEIKSMTPLVGYLNHDVSFKDDGWFRTGDAVQVIGETLKVPGRADDTINVAGRKFFPSELEELIIKIDNVADATVCRETNDLIGHAVVAKIALSSPEDETSFRARFKDYAEKSIPFFMHPHRIVLGPLDAMSSRFKKVRR